MSKSIEEIHELGVITCPHCQQVLDATNTDLLYKHIIDKHADMIPKLQLQIFLDSMCDVGILKEVPASD